MMLLLVSSSLLTLKYPCIALESERKIKIHPGDTLWCLPPARFQAEQRLA